MNDEGRTMKDGRWRMADGQWRMEDNLSVGEAKTPARSYSSHSSSKYLEGRGSLIGSEGFVQ